MPRKTLRIERLAKGPKRKAHQRRPKPAACPPIGHPGRPTKYYPAFAPRAHRLALLGLTDIEIADFLGVATSTLYLWKRRHLEFSEALQRGKLEADAKVAESLYKRAVGYDNPKAVKIFQGTEETGPIVVAYTEHYPPDVQAQRTWLNNRQSNLWRDKREIEHIGSIEARLRAMTPQQRHARLLELQAKVDAIAEWRRQHSHLEPVTTDQESIEGSVGESV